jgi:hypothetical protein
MIEDDREKLRTAFERAYRNRYACPGLEERVLSEVADQADRGRGRLEPLGFATIVTLLLAIAIVGGMLILAQLSQQRSAPAGGVQPSAAPSPTPAGPAAVIPVPTSSAPPSESPTPNPAPSPTPNSAPIPTPIAPAVAIPRCDVQDLNLQLGGSWAGLGQLNQTFVFTNTTPHTCYLFGYPGMRFLDRSGRPLTPDPQRGGAGAFPDISPRTVDLAPGTWHLVGSSRELPR